MRITNMLRCAAGAVALGALTLVVISAKGEASGQSSNIQNGEAGFVLFGFGNAYAHGPTECPGGKSVTFRQMFLNSPDGHRRDGESEQDFARRVAAGEQQMGHVNGENVCANPSRYPDPGNRIMTSTNVVSYGIDLDGQNSRANGRPAPGTCAHNDFNGVNGAHGVDNQMLRVVGCDSGGQAYSSEDTGDLPRGDNGVSEGMLQGGWGVLIRVKGIDNAQNDNDVQVGIYANADPIQLNAARGAIPNETYAADQDPRFRAETHGRIVNGVLTTDPVDVNFHWLVAGLHLERPLRHARLRVKFNGDGGFDGYLSGYTPVEAMYDINYGFRTAKTDTGQPANPGMLNVLTIGGNTVMGRTCNGAYAAMRAMADGDRDPRTGACSSISTQYWIRAAPAFVVDAVTHSVNEAH